MAYFSTKQNIYWYALLLLVPNGILLICFVILEPNGIFTDMLRCKNELVVFRRVDTAFFCL